jgi:hypothetical protein
VDNYRSSSGQGIASSAWPAPSTTTHPSCPTPTRPSSVAGHSDEILELAARFGIRDVKDASGSRLVGTAIGTGIMLPTYAFMEAAEEELGRNIPLYSQMHADWQPEDSEFHLAQPL